VNVVKDSILTIIKQRLLTSGLVVPPSGEPSDGSKLRCMHSHMCICRTYRICREQKAVRDVEQRATSGSQPCGHIGILWSFLDLQASGVVP